MKKSNLILIILILIVLTLANACTALKNDKEQLNQDKELHVAAASDLRFAFEELGRIFEEEKEIKVIFQFGSSGNLAHLIANGAPFDLFFSANKNFVEDLITSGDIIEESKSLYAIGRIVLATNKNTDVRVNSLEDLLSDDIEFIAIANPSHAPYGLAGKEALQSKGLWESLEDKLVFGENVSQAMQFVQTGNVQVGIIALSIANVEGIEYFLIDEALHNPLEQMLGVVSHSNKKGSAEAFAAFVNSTQGREVMEKYGFNLP